MARTYYYRTRDERYLGEPGAAAQRAFSPDGRWLAYVSDESGMRRSMSRCSKPALYRAADGGKSPPVGLEIRCGPEPAGSSYIRSFLLALPGAALEKRAQRIAT